MFTCADYTFWAIESIAFGCAAFFIARSKSIKKWRWLFTFCALQVFVNASLFVMLEFRNWAAYFYTQWYSEIVFGLLKILILCQVMRSALPGIAMVPRAIGKALLVAIVVAGVGSFFYGLVGFREAATLPIRVLILNRSVSMSVMGIFFTFAMFSSFFGLKWKSRALQVDMGLNLMAAADLLSFLAETNLHGKVLLAYHLQAAVHIGALIVWCRAFYSPDSDSGLATDDLLRAARQIHSELR